MSVDFDRLIHSEQVRSVYGQTLTIALSHPIAATLLAWIFKDIIEHEILISWLIATVVLIVVRVFVWYVFVQKDNRQFINPLWAKIFIFFSILQGLIWAYAWLTFIPANDPVYLIIVALWIMGLNAAVINGASMYLSVIYAFSIPAIAPGMIHFFVIGGQLGTTLGLAVLLYSVVIIRSVVPVNKLIVNAIRLNYMLQDEISERKKIEAELNKSKDEAESANKAKSFFLAVMSHEIRTPLNSILAMSEILSTDKEIQNKRNQQRLKILSTAGSHLRDLIEDILDISRIEANVNHLSNQPFDLREAVNSAINSVQNLANDKGLGLIVDIDHSVPSFFIGDVQRIRQILINLLTNAIKFTDSGQVDLQVYYSTDDSRAIHFIIKDTGLGLAKKDLKKIFEPFLQSDSSPTRKHQGAGLGLTISQTLVQQMGGNITAHNRSGGGAVFEFQLPLPVTQEAVVNSDKEKSEKVMPLLLSIPFNALVIEDSELNCLVIKEYLADENCNIQFVADAEQGLHLFKNNCFDIVLMDLHLPKMDGISAARMMRDWESKQDRHTTPIVIITADTLSDIEKHAANAGISAFMNKPMSKAGLFYILNQYIHTKPVIDAPFYKSESILETSTEEVEQRNAALEPLLPRFFKQMEEDIENMRLSIDNGDIQKIADLAHTTKGHSTIFNFPKLAQSSSFLQDIAKQATIITPELKAAWRQLKKEFEKTCTDQY